jgi:hypothetical protein
MGRAYSEIRQVPNEIVFSTVCKEGETIDKDTLVFQCFDALLDKRDSIGFIGDTFDKREVGLVLRDCPFRVRGFVRFCQVEAGNGIVGAERDGFFE